MTFWSAVGVNAILLSINNICPEYLSAVGGDTPEAEKVFPAVFKNTLPTAGTAFYKDCNKTPVEVKETILNNGPLASPRLTCIS